METTKVFLVDDNPSFLQGLQRFLSLYEHVFIVGTAPTAHEALQSIDRLKPRVVFVDLVLPDMSGLKLIEIIKRESPATGLIAISMHNSAQYRDAALEAGAHQFVSKSDISGKLIPALEATLMNLQPPL